MRIESTPDRVQLSRPGKWVWPLGLVVLGGLVGLLGADTFHLRCERTADRCTYMSVGVVGGLHEGEFALSEVASMADEQQTRRGSNGNTVYNSVRHTAQFYDGRSVSLEPRLRDRFVDDGLHPRFTRFQSSGAARLDVRELHFGFAGIFVIAFTFLGLVLLVLARSVTLTLDRRARMYSFRRRGVVGGFASSEGPLSDLVQIEVNDKGSYLGVYLAHRDGRRYKLVYGSAGQAEKFAAETVAQTLGVPLVGTDDTAVQKHARGILPIGALGCMLLALSPLAVPGVWCVLSWLFTEFAS